VIHLLLVDNHPWVRQGLRMRLALEPDLTVVGEARDVRHALVVMRELCPDVVIMDVELPGIDGISGIDLLGRCAQVPAVVVLLTLRDDRLTRERAIAAGAAAVVGKQEVFETLLAAVRGAASRNGHRLVRPPP
jgi:NarL family two-component system response regulator LiaR